MLQQLQNNYRLMQQHQQQMRLKQQKSGTNQLEQSQNSSVIKQFPEQSRGDLKSTDDSIIDNTTENHELDRELQALLSQKELTTSLAEDLLKQFGSSEELNNIKMESEETTGITAKTGFYIFIV